MHRTLEYQFSRLPTDGLFHWQKNVYQFHEKEKNGGQFERRAPIGDGIRHVTATSQFTRVILFKRVYFWQYFVCLRERISNFCNVLLSR